MTTRVYRKIRRKVESFTNYEISESFGLFGDFTKSSPKHTIKADSHLNALKRYFKWYERKYKEKHRNFSHYPIEVTSLWGRFKIVDEQGKTLYFT